MIIDIHTHITYQNFPEFANRILHRTKFDVDVLLHRMDIEGIDKSVVLPLMNPEVIDRYGCAGNQEVIEACRCYPDRLIPFCGIDPRSMLYFRHDGFYTLLKVYQELGCRGIGEVCGSIWIDDLRYEAIFQAAGELKMPLLFHFQPDSGTSYGVYDDFGLPRLEKMLQKFPETIFIGHSLCFWGEISAELPADNRENFQPTPYSKKGRLWELFSQYPNLRGDISAGSGNDAITPDIEKGVEFINKFSSKLYFGTDRFSAIDEPIPPQLPLLRELLAQKRISKIVFDAITSENAQNLLI